MPPSPAEISDRHCRPDPDPCRLLLRGPADLASGRGAMACRAGLCRRGLGRISGWDADIAGGADDPLPPAAQRAGRSPPGDSCAFFRPNALGFSSKPSRHDSHGPRAATQGAHRVASRQGLTVSLWPTGRSVKRPCSRRFSRAAPCVGDFLPKTRAKALPGLRPGRV